MLFPGKDIDPKMIGRMYVIHLRDKLDFYKTAAYDAHSGNKGIGADLWRFSSAFGKIKIWLFKLKFDWMFRKKWRINPFYDVYFDPKLIEDHRRFLIDLCKNTNK